MEDYNEEYQVKILTKEHTKLLQRLHTITDTDFEKKLASQLGDIDAQILDYDKVNKSLQIQYNRQEKHSSESQNDRFSQIQDKLRSLNMLAEKENKAHLEIKRQEELIGQYES